MEPREVIKAVLPKWALRQYRTLWQRYHQWRILARMEPLERRLYQEAALASREHIHIDPVDETAYRLEPSPKAFDFIMPTVRHPGSVAPAGGLGA